MRECTRGKAPARCAACRRCPLASLLHRDAQGTNGEAMTDMCLRRYVEQHVRERGGQEPTVPRRQVSISAAVLLPYDCLARPDR